VVSNSLNLRRRRKSLKEKPHLQDIWKILNNIYIVLFIKGKIVFLV